MTEAESPSAIERCVGDVARFLAEDWAMGPSLHPNPGARSFDDLLTMEDVDRLLATTGLRRPAFRLVKDGATLPPASYTRSGRTGSAPVTGMADPGRILSLFRDGATIVFQGMHRYWLPLARFCRDLELALGHPTQVNAYITPPGARGLAIHEDSHDVFVLQAFGRKQWQVWPTRRGSGGSVTEAATAPGPTTNGAPLLDIDMHPGDSLYLPVGTPHAARAQDEASGHLTIGVLTTTWQQVLRQVFRQLEDEPDLLGRLPVGYHRDPDGFRALVDARLRDLERRVAKVDPEDVAASVIRRFLITRTPVQAGGFMDVLAVDTVGDYSVVRRRQGSVCHMSLREGRLSAYLGDRELRMPASLQAAMENVAGRGTEPFRPSDLAGFLDRAGRVALVRRLVREGLLEVVVGT